MAGRQRLFEKAPPALRYFFIDLLSNRTLVQAGSFSLNLLFAVLGNCTSKIFLIEDFMTKNNIIFVFYPYGQPLLFDTVYVTLPPF